MFAATILIDNLGGLPRFQVFSPQAMVLHLARIHDRR
jgi:hypothetical protein